MVLPGNDPRYLSWVTQQDALQSASFLKNRKKQEAETLFAELQPQAYYSTMIAGLEPAKKEFLSYKFNDVYNEFQASKLKNTASGVPTGGFNNFLKTYDFNKLYMAQPYINRGGYQARNLVTPTRFLNF